jgi:hypothetical protein
MPIPSLPALPPSDNLSIHNETMVGWVAGPHTRGTMSLLLSCLTTIFLCTWTVLHLDVPRNDEKRTMLAMFGRKAIWMVLAAIAPEILVSFATNDYLEARKTRRVLSSRSGRNWSLNQAFFLNMHGLVYTSPDEDGGTATAILTKHKVEELLGTSVGSQLEATLKFEDLPSDATIQDKSKSDSLAKSLALLQCTWFVAQVIARAIDSLPITTLELGTTALIGCASVAYGFWWYKPQEVRTPIEIRSLEKLQPSSGLPDGDDNPFNFFTDQPTLVLAFLLTVAFVGGIHCAAWNFFFPTPFERLLWRIASIVVLVLPLLELLTILRFGSSVDIMTITNVFIIPWLYANLRLFLIIEMFVSLRGVPGEVYHQLPWSDFIPHL